MVVDQGTILDRIDFNMDVAVTNMKDANQDLTKADEYQKKAQCSLYVMIALVFSIAIVLIVLIIRHASGQSASTRGN